MTWAWKARTRKEVGAARFPANLHLPRKLPGRPSPSPSHDPLPEAFLTSWGDGLWLMLKPSR